MRVFVSGAAGYIGGAVARALASAHIELLGGIRQATKLPDGMTPIVTGDLATANMSLNGVTAVIHAAGLGHRRGVPTQVWRCANIDAAANLARIAKRDGVEKFILISTAHVHGRVHGGVVSDSTAPNPMDDYATSKLQAELAVAEIFGPALSIIRPVAVIGPHCPGNIPFLIKLLQLGIPLPFGSIQNQRSFIHVDDLARLVLAVLNAPEPQDTILAAHPQPISTPNLIRALAAGMSKPARLLPCPPGLLAAAARATGRAAMWQSLAGSFTAAPETALSLGWAPRQALSESLAETSRYYDTTSMIP